MKRSWPFALLLFFVSTPLAAQTFTQGFLPFQSYDETDFDSVNLANGNLVEHIPIISYPQRGTLPDVGIAAIYNNMTWEMSCVYYPATGAYKCSWYWPGYQPGYSSGGGLRIVQTNELASQKVRVSRTLYYFYAVAPDGATHSLQGFTSGGNNITYTPDATGIQLGPGGLRDTNGISYVEGTGLLLTYPTSIQDPSGNTVTLGTSNITDSVGRTIPYAPTLSSPGCTTAYYPAVNGGTVPVEACYANYSVQSNIKDVDVCDWSGTIVMLQSITLPNGATWTFNYDSYGDLSSVTLPTGGQVSYTWSLPSGAGGGNGTCNDDAGDETGFTTSRVMDSRTIDPGNPSQPKTWTYSGYYPGNTTTVTGPDGNYVVHTFGLGSVYETNAQYYDKNSNLLKTVSKSYFSLGLDDVVPKLVTTTWPNGQVSQICTIYDQNTNTTCTGTDAFSSSAPMSYNPSGIPLVYGSLLYKYEYDYGSGAPGPLLRQTNTQFLWQSNSNYLTANLLNRASSVTVLNGSGTQMAQTTYGYDESLPGNYTSCSPGPCGNQTSITRWLNTGPSNPKTQNIYNSYAMRTSTIDPNGNTTSFTYDSTHAYLSQITYPTTNSVAHVEHFTYDFDTGLKTSTTDQNSQITQFGYDSMRRLTSVTFPTGGGSETYSYNDAVPNPSFTFTKQINSTTNLVEEGIIDGLARQTRTQKTVPASTCGAGYVYVDTTYDNESRKFSVSNPYCTTSDPTYGLTQTYYDALDRPILKVPPGGTVPTSNVTCLADDVCTSYAGNTTTVTDETGKSRKSASDGLGRLTTVWEDPAGLDYQTNYQYDANGNLTSATQGGSRQRSFVYDSLSRLTQSTNPEPGTVSYTYDLNGNVLTKIDARSITTNYSPSGSPIDALNRVTSVTYTDGTTTATYTYDQSACLGQPACYNVGRRTSMTDAGGSENFSYDTMGREIAEQRITSSITKTTTYAYDLAGDLSTLTYPSGNIITYSYDSAARPISAVDTAHSITYATSASYAPQDALGALTLGPAGSFAGINLSDTYNNRLEPNELKAWSTAGTAMDLTYGFVDANSNNNGNVVQIANNKDTTRSQSFGYDSINRVATAKTSSTTGSNCWGEQFGYDQWANLLSIGAASGYSGCTQENLSVSAATNNQLSATGFSYDASGNMLTDSANTYAWNAESEIKSAAGVNYTYDGDGNRVEKSNGKIYWYGAGTEILDESDGGGNITNEYVFFGGKRIAVKNVGSGSVSYYVEDFLGSSRVITTATGTVCYEADFYPFGGERIITNTCPQNYKFEGKERDTETNNDDFGARYYTSRLGRWLSSDWSAVPAAVPYADLTNPQTLNLYAMVRDNPETFSDLDGHDSAGQLGPGCSPHCEIEWVEKPKEKKEGTTKDSQNRTAQQDQQQNNQAQKDDQQYHKQVQEREAQVRAKQAAPSPGSPEYVAQVSGQVSAEMHAGNEVIGGVAIVEAAGVVTVAATSATAEAVVATAERAAAHPVARQGIDFAQGYVAAKAHFPGPGAYPRTPAGIAGYIAGKLLPF